MLTSIADRLRNFFFEGGHDSDRRAEERVDQDQRTIVLDTERVKTAFRLRNLSSRGASGETDIILAIGDPVTLEFERGETAQGTVKWLRGKVVGIAFGSPLSLDVVQAREVAPERFRNRAARYQVKRAAIVVLGRQRRPAVIRNVSTTGMMIESAFTLMPGQNVVVEVGTMEIGAQVRWSGHGRAGLVFNKPISLERFDSIDAGMNEAEDQPDQ